MPLPWIRLDTTMPTHPKILALLEYGTAGKAAAFVWVCSLTYAGAHGTDGYIPKGALSRINGTPRDAKLLVETELWHAEHTGWIIHGWDEYQESTEETQARSERARHAAQARWAKNGRLSR